MPALEGQGDNSFEHGDAKWVVWAIEAEAGTVTAIPGISL